MKPFLQPTHDLSPPNRRAHHPRLPYVSVLKSAVPYIFCHLVASAKRRKSAFIPCLEQKQIFPTPGVFKNLISRLRQNKLQCWGKRASELYLSIFLLTFHLCGMKSMLFDTVLWTLSSACCHWTISSAVPQSSPDSPRSLCSQSALPQSLIQVKLFFLQDCLFQNVRPGDSHVQHFHSCSHLG